MNFQLTIVDDVHYVMTLLTRNILTRFTIDNEMSVITENHTTQFSLTIF